MTSGKCGDNLTWTLDDDGTLTISGRGDMENYSLEYNDQPWYDKRKLINEIIIKPGITLIGYYAFVDCSSLSSIKISEGITSIGRGAFLGCRSLLEVKIPNSIIHIGSVAFSGCNSLATIKIPEGVISIGAKTFSGCNNLTSVKISETVTYIAKKAFNNCYSLSEIKIPNGVNFIGENAFRFCSALTNIEFPNNLTSISSRVFFGCSSLAEIKLPPSLVHVGNKVFSECTSLKEIYYKRGTKIDLKSLTVGNNAKLIPYDELPPVQVKPPAQAKPPVQAEPSAQAEPPAKTNCTVYRNTKISRAENIAPPNAKSLSRVDENIAEIRRAAELAAMNIVMTIERDLGFSPEDVSSQNLGYDIKSTSRDGKTLRLIEVKGRHIDAETVTVSRNEIDAALNNPDDFILAIVRLDGGKNETIYIRQPFEQPPDRAALSVNFSIQKLVEVSKAIPG